MSEGRPGAAGAVRSVRTVCPYCGVGCGLQAEVRGSRLTGVSGDPSHPVNRGRLCSKPLGLPEAVDAVDRATVPLVRRSRDDRFERSSWDEALRTTADRLCSIRAAHGPDAIAFYVSGQLLTEDYYVVNKLAKGFLGTNNVDSNSRLCMASAVSGYRASFGSDGPPPAYADIEAADCFLLLGTNTAACHPIVWARICDRREQGAFVIVADPRRTETAAAADLHLGLRPGTDLALLNAMLHVVEREGLVDRDYVARHTAGYEEMARVAAEWPPERAAEVCGIPAAAIVEAARRFATAQASMALWAVGANQSTVGTLKTQALNNLCLVTGQIGRPGAGPLSLTGQPNAMGGRETGGFAGGLPGYRSTAVAADREAMGRLWRLPEGGNGISAAPGLAATELFDALEQGAVRAVWICATNPAASMPDTERTRAALERAELVVCQDAYHPTETSALAHVVLPAAQWPEKEGTMTNSERRVALVRKALDPPGEALPDWEIFARLGRALGFEKAFGFETAGAVYDEFARCTAGRVCDQSGISHALLRRRSLQWPFPAERPAPSGGTRRLYADHRYPTSDGRARLAGTPHAEPAEAPDERYPIVLTTGRVASHWHTMTRTAKSTRLSAAEPEPFLEIHPADATRSGVGDGELVRVRSRRGETVLRARIVRSLPEGTVFAPFHWGSLHAAPGTGTVNATTIRAIDPVSRQPELKACAVRLEPVGRAPGEARAGRRGRGGTRLLVVGGGMAGLATVESAFEHVAPEAWRTTILAREPEPPYDRTRLSRLVEGSGDASGLALRQRSWYAAAGVDVRLATEARAIDLERRLVLTSDGGRHGYDVLVLATGSRPVLPPIRGVDRDGVHTLRTLADARLIAARARSARRALVVGGGLLGLELADSLHRAGTEVTVVHLMDHLMEAQLDQEAARLLEETMRGLGIETRCGAEAVEVLGERGATGLRLASGEELAGDLVVIATGIEPEVELARTAGLEVRRGIVVDDELRTSAPSVWAVGECAEHRGLVCGVWRPLLAQARVAGASIAGQPAGFHGLTPDATLHVAGVELFAAGRHSAVGTADHEVVVTDTESARYQKLVIADDRLAGCILLHDVSAASRVRDLIDRRRPVSFELLTELVDPTAAPPLEPGALVCACHGVSRAMIAATAREEGLETLDEVIRATRAGSACGTCTPVVERLMEELQAERLSSCDRLILGGLDRGE